MVLTLREVHSSRQLKELRQSRTLQCYVGWRCLDLVKLNLSQCGLALSRHYRRSAVATQFSGLKPTTQHHMLLNTFTFAYLYTYILYIFTMLMQALHLVHPEWQKHC